MGANRKNVIRNQELSMIKFVSYATPIILLASSLKSLLYPGTPHWILLAFVLASPLFIIWLAVYERT